MENGFTIWITGLPGAGKTAMAAILKELISTRGKNVALLSDDETVELFGGDLGRDEDSWALYTARLVYICNKVTETGGVAIAASATPFRELRDDIRAELGSYFEIYIHTEPCEAASEPTDANLFEMVKDVFEEPYYPEHRFDPSESGVKEAVDLVLERLVDMNLIDPAGERDYSDEDEQKIEERLRGLGYIE